MANFLPFMPFPRHNYYNYYNSYPNYYFHPKNNDKDMNNIKKEEYKDNKKLQKKSSKYNPIG